MVKELTELHFSGIQTLGSLYLFLIIEALVSPGPVAQKKSQAGCPGLSWFILFLRQFVRQL